MKLQSKLLLILLFFILNSCVSHTSKSGSQRTLASAPASEQMISEQMVNGLKIPVLVVGGDEKTFSPPEEKSPVPAELLNENYDAVVVGGGLAGLSAAVYLSDKNLKVLVLEKEKNLGGLAAHGVSSQDGILYDRGAAYWTSSYEEELEILKHIGLGDYEKRFAIKEPIDNFYWQGKLYIEIWDEKTLEKLPASFALFKKELQNANSEGFIPNQPIEEAVKYKQKMDLDKIDAAKWIRSMPARMAARKDLESSAIYQRFLSELKQNKMNPKDPMSGVLELMDMYCRSALGANPKDVSALAFANFYISEIEVRYTSDTGTTEAAGRMVKILSNRPNVTLSKKSQVTKINHDKDGVQVVFIKNQTTYSVNGKYVVFAAPIKFAPEMITGFKKSQNPNTKMQVKLMQSIDYSHYSVHNLELKGHPFRLSYDLWSRPLDYKPDDFTDFILSRWVELNGYEGYRDFAKRPEGQGLIALYHPLPKSYLSKPYSEEEATRLARSAAERFTQIYQPVFDEMNPSGNLDESKIEITRIATSRWPFSVHVAKPGHFIHDAKILRRPYKRVYFANNNLGTPAFEEALFRGHCAANNILKKMDLHFENETWSRCPIEEDRLLQSKKNSKK